MNDAVSASGRTHFIDGRWSPGGGRTFPVFNPYNNEVVAEIAAGGRAEAEAAVKAAHAAFPAWAAMTPGARQTLFLRAADIINRRAEDILRVMAVETGSGRAFSMLQIRWSANLIRQAASWGYLPYGDVLRSDVPGRFAMVTRKPLGVVAGFTPWNGAFNLAWRTAILPLAFGNTVVIKPSEEAPMSAGLLHAEILDEAGFPPGVGVPELRFLAAIAPTGPDALFFAGDLGQRIFQQPFSWKELGVDVRGRSFTLTVNYRTSHQIRRMADRLLPSAVRDVDGLGDDRDRTVSIFNGPDPELARYASRQDETAGVSTWLRAIMASGVAPSEIGVFVRSRDQMDRARAVVTASGVEALELSERDEAPGQRMPVGTMHLAKGLEFKAVVVMACDDDVLPLRSRVESVADEVELDDVYETERHLFYVACTRARDRLLVSGVLPASEFLADIADMAYSIGTAAVGTP